jgi:hypothetical protein
MRRERRRRRHEERGGKVEFGTSGLQDFGTSGLQKPSAKRQVSSANQAAKLYPLSDFTFKLLPAPTVLDTPMYLHMLYSLTSGYACCWSGPIGIPGRLRLLFTVNILDNRTHCCPHSVSLPLRPSGTR